MKKDLVLFKNSPDRLLLVLDGEAPFEKLLDVIKEKVVNNVSFFQGYDLVLKYKGRQLDASQEEDICKIFNEAGASVSEISEEKIRIKKLQNKDLNSLTVRNLARGSFSKKRGSRTLVKSFNEGQVRFFRGTVRSGQTIEFEGSVVIMGDVNPGAEIIAGGNIIVFGTIRGSVSAGAGGNDQAFIIGRNINPTLISISSIRSIPPEEEAVEEKRFFKFRSRKNKSLKITSDKDLEVAYIKNGNIYIESYDSVF